MFNSLTRLMRQQNDKMTSLSFRSGNASDDYQEESGLMDNIEDQLIEAFDDIMAKSAKSRLVAFELLRKNLTERYMMNLIYSRKITVLDAIGRCIKRSKGQDLGHAANLIAILCANIGPSPETDPIFSELITQLLSLLVDQTIASEVRRKCARTIAMCAFIMGVEGYLEQIMDRLLTIFSSACAKGDGTMPTPNEQSALLYATCVQAWTLLLTAVQATRPATAIDLIEEYMDKITELIDSPNLDIQISAGESLAVMCEIIRSQNENITADDFDELCDKLREIMTDNQKSRGKKDNRQQKSNFREILAAIEDNETPHIIIKFGRERLVLETWSRRRQYEAFCDIFGPGLNLHLAENEVVRDIFELGPVIIHMDLPKIKSSDTYHENMVADKVRTKNLRKLRDKRAVVLN